MSERWLVEPEPSEDELAALIVALVAVTSVQNEPEPESQPISAWRQAARREAVSAGGGIRWEDRF